MTKKDKNKVYTGVYFDRAQHKKLRALSRRTKVTVAVYLREGIDLVLKKHKKRRR